MYSYALSRAASEEDLIAAYLATAARFEKHIASLDVVEAAQCDEQCLVLLEGELPIPAPLSPPPPAPERLPSQCILHRHQPPLRGRT